MSSMITRRHAIAASFSAACSFAAGSDAMTHFQIGGDWCFVGLPAKPIEPRRAVIVFDGNGTTVTAESSSWEKDAAAASLGRAILDAGFLIAQSNRAARPDNGMWGNAASQHAVLALIDHLRRRYAVQHFSALTVSAGGITLLNLLLNRTAAFHTVVLFAPVISLESMYRCPAGINRVTPIGEAFHFQPLQGCPGAPDTDAEFRRATGRFDPMRRLEKELAGNWMGVKIPWFVLYHQHDPKVPPPENAARFVSLMRRAGARVRVAAPEGNTHNSADLMRNNAGAVVEFLTAQ
jgi:pimeloyl-ACP methyl ester carboxylesterase